MVSDDKCALRRALRARRRELSLDVVRAAGTAVRVQVRLLLVAHPAAALLAYLATENEIPTDGIIADCVQARREMYLPSTTPVPRFVCWQPGDRLQPGPGGVLEPHGGLPLPGQRCAIALIPLVGWADDGTRLGRGAGFYDRVFATGSSGILRLGLAYEFQRCDYLPRDPWDVPMDYIITEQRIVRCGAGEVLRSESLQKGGLRLC